MPKNSLGPIEGADLIDDSFVTPGYLDQTLQSWGAWTDPETGKVMRTGPGFGMTDTESNPDGVGDAPASFKLKSGNVGEIVGGKVVDTGQKWTESNTSFFGDIARFAALSAAAFFGVSALGAVAGGGGAAASGGWVSAEGGAGYLGGMAADTSELAAAATAGGVAGDAVAGSSAPATTPATSGGGITDTIGQWWNEGVDGVKNLFSGSGTTTAAQTPADIAASGGDYMTASQAPAASKGLIGSALEWAGKNPSTLMTAGLTGASIIGGAGAAARQAETAANQIAANKSINDSTLEAAAVRQAAQIKADKEAAAVLAESKMIKGAGATDPRWKLFKPTPLRRPDGSLVYAPGIINSAIPRVA